MMDEAVDGAGDAARSRTSRVLRWALGMIVVALALLVVAHVVIRPVAPAQDAPSDHFGEPCLLCHLVLDGAEMVDVQ